MSYEIGTGNLVLHYQPRVSVRGCKIVCVEALVRWHTPGGCLVGPEFFIANAERFGAIVGIGRWVLETAVRQAARWAKEGRAMQVAVNVSALQIDCADFAGELEGLLARYGLPPGLLEIELTESAHVADVEAAARQFERLCDDGVALALDDRNTRAPEPRSLHCRCGETMKSRAHVNSATSNRRAGHAKAH